MSKKYKAILLDPQWHFETYDKKSSLAQRAPKQHYKTEALANIARMPVPEHADKNCVLFMWVTAPHLEQAFQLINLWGFKFKSTAFIWVKTRDNQIDFFEEPEPPIKMGYWTRKQCEICLIATKGNPKRLNADVREVILRPTREHSRKPDDIYDRIERLVDGPYIEFNARQKKDGWDQYGDEVDRFEVES